MADGDRSPDPHQRKVPDLTASEKADLHRPIMFGRHQWKFKAFTAIVTAGALVALLLLAAVVVTTCTCTGG